jgi:hypothetical protein
VDDLQLFWPFELVNVFDLDSAHTLVERQVRAINERDADTILSRRRPNQGIGASEIASTS